MTHIINGKDVTIFYARIDQVHNKYKVLYERCVLDEEKEKVLNQWRMELKKITDEENEFLNKTWG